MLSPTLADGLKSYSIGEKLHALRLKKKLGLVELGKHTKLSPALLSKIERGKMFPTLPTLLRIAMVFSVGLDFFFLDDPKRKSVAVVRRSDRKRFPEQSTGKNPAFDFECLDFPAVERKLNAYYANFHRLNLDNVHLHQHPGAEFIYVIDGKLGLTINSEEIFLEAGDSVYFDSSLPHGYRSPTNKSTSALIVTVP